MKLLEEIFRQQIEGNFVSRLEHRQCQTKDVAQLVDVPRPGIAVASLDSALVELQPDIVRLVDKYGFPREAPVNLDAANTLSNAASTTIVATAAGNASALSESDDKMTAGKELFNNHCSHCHAPNAASPIRERDLRRLKLRYGDKWREVATTTIKDGRLDIGMPMWKDILNEERIGLLLNFFDTIQREP